MILQRHRLLKLAGQGNSLESGDVGLSHCRLGEPCTQRLLGVLGFALVLQQLLVVARETHLVLPQVIDVPLLIADQRLHIYKLLQHNRVEVARVVGCGCLVLRRDLLAERGEAWGENGLSICTLKLSIYLVEAWLMGIHHSSKV